MQLTPSWWCLCVLVLINISAVGLVPCSTSSSCSLPVHIVCFSFMCHVCVHMCICACLRARVCDCFALYTMSFLPYLCMLYFVHGTTYSILCVVSMPCSVRIWLLTVIQSCVWPSLILHKLSVAQWDLCAFGEFFRFLISTLQHTFDVLSFCTICLRLATLQFCVQLSMVTRT